MVISRRSVIVGSVAFLGSTALTKPALAVEPFTSIWLAAAIAEAGLKWATGSLLDAAMGGFTLSDVYTWIRQAVAEIEAFVSAKLDEKILEKIRADVEAMRDFMNEYASLKPSRRMAGKYLLEKIDTRSAELLHLSFNYPQAMSIGLVALGYRLLAITSLYKLERAAGFIIGNKELVDDCIVNFHKMYLGFHKSLSPESRIRVDCWEDDPPGQPGDPTLPPPVGSYFCAVALDGNGVKTWETTYINQEASVRKSANDYVESTLKPPVLENQRSFDAATLACFYKVVDTYSAMCKSVGVAYKSPVDLPARLINDGMPRTLFMPGAAVIGTN